MTGNHLAVAALINAVIARVEGMKADNALREMQGHTIAYDGSHFFAAEEELEALAIQAKELAE